MAKITDVICSLDPVGMEAASGIIEGVFAEGGIFVLGVCGLSGSGKTTLSNALCRTYPDIVRHFDCDRFSALGYAERQAHIEKSVNSGDPALLAEAENPLNWYAWDEIGNALDVLREKRTLLYKRAWNNETGLLDADYSVSLPATGPAVILCDGIYLLHSPVRQWMDATLYIEASFDITIARGRNRSADSAHINRMERLHRTYSQPYFDEYASKADLVCRASDFTPL